MKHPRPVCFFQVEWGGERIGFTSVEGLDQTIDVIEYREGNMKSDQVMLIPGMRRSSTLVLRRGIVPGDNGFEDWLRTVFRGDAERRDMTISLLNEVHEPVTVWKIRSAWPCGLTGPRLDALQSEIALESLTLVHEGISVEFT
ncbi:phage tail protein [soil metagenome]